MPPAPPRFLRRVFVVGLLVAVAVPAAAGGGKPAKPPKAKPESAPEKLPDGCTRLTDGYGAVISPKGKWIATVHGGPMASSYTIRTVTPLTLEVKERKGDAPWPLPMPAAPIGWVDDTLLLDAGYGISPVNGARHATVASLPKGTKAIDLAWTRDGKRLAWVPDMLSGKKTEIRVVGLDGKAAPLSGTTGLRNDQAVFLAWSPDGSRLYVNGLFQDGNAIPVRRVGLVDAATGEMTTLATMPDWIGIPGLSGQYSAYYRDPRIEHPKEVELDWKRPAEPRYGRQVWSADGKWAAWLAGTGWIEADAYVVEAATGTVKRVTIDGDAKWSPAIDPAGRRLAFIVADNANFLGKDLKARIRIVDLLTGEPTELPLAALPDSSSLLPNAKPMGFAGIPAWLSWTPDGAALVYDVRGMVSEGSFLQAVPAAKPAPKDAVIRSLEYSPRNRVVSWLSSYDADRVHTAVHRAEDAWDDFYLTALREALQSWKDKPSSVVHCMSHMFDLRHMKETIPDLKAALDSKLEENRVSILIALLDLGESDAMGGLDVLRKSTTDKETRLRIALAMVKAGDERGWPSVAEASQSTDAYLRQDVCRALAKIKHPKSVDILIPLVGDKRTEGRIPSLKTTPVGPVAQLALKALTGKSLGDDPAKWRAWWKDEAKGVLPENVPPPADPGNDLGG